MEYRKHRFPASITVEASYVMAMVIIAFAVLIRAASNQCIRTTQAMYLHHVTEQLRYRESDEERILSCGQVIKKSCQVEGYIETDGWEKKIKAKVYEPEEILRLLTIFEQEGEGEE